VRNVLSVLRASLTPRQETANSGDMPAFLYSITCGPVIREDLLTIRVARVRGKDGQLEIRLTVNPEDDSDSPD
jgi:hypothetical protein